MSEIGTTARHIAVRNAVMQDGIRAAEKGNRMDKRTRTILYAYWMRNDLGRRMILSDSVSDSDLLFMVPNNVKRRPGLPLTRIAKRRKAQYKRNLKRKILSFKLFDIIGEIIEETIQKGLSEEHFYKFVDVNDYGIGDKHQFANNFETYSLPWNRTRNKLEKSLWIESKKG